MKFIQLKVTSFIREYRGFSINSSTVISTLIIQVYNSQNKKLIMNT